MPRRTVERPNSPMAALRVLMDGHEQYHDGKASFGNYRAERAMRALGQAPIAAVLSCADSRVPPEMLFNQGPGNLFVVRVAGNVENAEALASLEYGTHFLGIPLIVVLGHTGCGAVEAAIKTHRESVVLPGHLPGLIDMILPAVRDAETAGTDDLLATATIANIRQTVRDIQAAKPLLSAKVASGAVLVVGAVYDIAKGEVLIV